MNTPHQGAGIAAHTAHPATLPTAHARADTQPAAAHPCAARPVPASVARQRESALDSAFARALRDADEPPLVSAPSARAQPLDACASVDRHGHA